MNLRSCLNSGLYCTPQIPLGNKPSQLALIQSRGYRKQQYSSEFQNRLRPCQSEERLCQIKHLGTLEWGSTQTKLLFFFITQLSRRRGAQRGKVKIADPCSSRPAQCCFRSLLSDSQLIKCFCIWTYTQKLSFSVSENI